MVQIYKDVARCALGLWALPLHSLCSLVASVTADMTSSSDPMFAGGSFEGNFSLICMSVYVCIYIYVYICTYIYMYIYIYEPGSKLPLLYSGKEGCSMSRDMLKPLQKDTGHPKKRYPKTIPPRPATRYGAP